MINSAVYIPTNRPQMILKSVQTMEQSLRDADLDIPVFVVVEQRLLGEVTKDLRSFRVGFVVLSEAYRGIGYSRYHAVRHASAQGFGSILMIDDDEKVRGDLREWCHLAEDDDVIGMGSFRSIYGLLYKDTDMVAAARRKEDHVFLHKGSAGYQSFALNVRNALRAGNFNPELRAFEDHELCRQGMRVLGLPWFIYTGIQGDDLLSRSDQEAMGIASISQKGDGYYKAHEIVYKLWPKYISRPGKKYSCQWKMLVERYVKACYWPLEDILTQEPFDWRSK